MNLVPKLRVVSAVVLCVVALLPELIIGGNTDLAPPIKTMAQLPPHPPMGKNQKLTTAQRGAIVYGHQSGHSYQKIANTVSCGKTTVHDVLKRLAEMGPPLHQSDVVQSPYLTLLLGKPSKNL